MNNTMTPGQALDWMIANPGKELVDSNNEKWRVGSQFIENNHVGRSNGWVPANHAALVEEFDTRPK